MLLSWRNEISVGGKSISTSFLKIATRSGGRCRFHEPFISIFQSILYVNLCSSFQTLVFITTQHLSPQQGSLL